MKAEDPKRVAARERREEANLWFAILRKGIGEALNDAYNPEEVERVVRRVNGELAEAAKEVLAADEAYRPFQLLRGRRRRYLARTKMRKAS